jgi:hypothetical protein
MKIMVTLSLVRADGKLNYSKAGTSGTFASVLPPIYEIVEAQLKANLATEKEADTFIAEFNRKGTAELSFPERRFRFFC